MKDKGLLAVLLIPAVLLLIPLAGTLTSPEWNWKLPSFLVAYGLLTGVGLSFRALARRSRHHTYRLASALMLATALLLLWANMAVGLIGSEDNPMNTLYLGVILIGLATAAQARFRAPGMARALWVTAAAQAAVPVIALFVRPTDFSPGVTKVFVLNSVFVVLFVLSGLLYQHAARVDRSPGSLAA